MYDLDALLVVPVLGFVVLSTLLVVVSQSSRCFGLGTAGILGVALGGPGAIFLLSPRTAAAVEVEQVANSEVLERIPAATGDSPAPQDSPPAVQLIEAVSFRVRYPADRPAWVQQPPEQLGGHDVHYVESGPRDKNVDCQRLFDQELMKAANKYIQDYLQSPYAVNFMHFEAAEIKERFLNDQYTYEELVNTSVGPMHQKHALVVFDDERFHRELDSRWREVLATARLFQTALFGGAALGLLGVLFSYLRLDTATRGFYTGRLQFIAIAAILALIATGVFVSRWIPWF